MTITDRLRALRTWRHVASRPSGLHGLAWAVAAAVIVTASAAFAASFPVASKNLTVLKTCNLTANPRSTTVMIDSAVRQASPTSNFGTATTMDIRTASANRRSYLRFDLTKCRLAIPSSATVKLATLRLYGTVLPTACRTNDIFRASAAWTETGITWNNQPFGTSLNNPASGQRTASIDIGTSPCQNSTANQYVTGWNVTTDVQAFVAGTATNDGWMIRDDVEGSSTVTTATYSTKDANVLAQAPQLIITYAV